MDGSFVSLERVSFDSEGYPVLRDVTLSFPPGKSTVIMGHSGSGKSTLLKVAAGLIPPVSGKLFFGGSDFATMSDRQLMKYRRSWGFVFQDAALWANMSVYQNLALPVQVHSPGIRKGELDEKIRRTVRKYGLERELGLRPAQLSMGEQKIISFIRALINGPDVLFLDEPTASVDHSAAELMLSMIREFKSGGGTIVAVTHDSRLTSMIADHLVLVKDGSILNQGPFELLVRTADREEAAILAEVLNQAATFDTDILELLEPEEDNSDKS